MCGKRWGGIYHKRKLKTLRAVYCWINWQVSLKVLPKIGSSEFGHMARFNGKPEISRSTHTAGRTILSVSLAVIVFHYTGSSLEKMQVFGVPVRERTIEVGLIVTLSTAIVGLLVNWMGDALAFTKWELGIPWLSAPKGGGRKLPRYAEVSRLVNVGSKMLNGLRDLERAREFPDDEIPKELKSALREIERGVSDFDQAVGGYKNHLWTVWHWAAFEVFIWHFMVPVSLAIWAIVLLSIHLALPTG